jgi:PKD domain
MMSNSNILYPNSFDSDTNLYAVSDAINLTLAEDYNPGDSSITVTGNTTTMSRIPATGLITLTEQCSDPKKRAITFSYTEVNTTTGVFTGITLRPGFPDVFKPNTVTDVTLNVMAEHHNSLKDALIAIQGFAGVKGTIDTVPFGTTLEGRINFLRQIVLQPRAWFESNINTGNVPLTVEFTNKSFRLGTDGTSISVVAEWDFGDNTTSVVSNISTIIASSSVPNIPNVFVIEQGDDGTIKKTYYNAGEFNVTLTVTNDFGSDQVTFNNFINARIPAPNEAVIKYTGASGQTVVPGIPTDGPYTVVPTIRSPINTLIQMAIPAGENPDTPGFSFAGEPLNSANNPLDPINSFTWSLGDDLNHPNSSATTAAYSVGGIYDLKLRVDTEFGAYRITTYSNSINIIENVNLWLWVFTDLTDTSVVGYEYGLISETFKLTTNATQVIARDASFLDSVPSEAQQKQEFLRNDGSATRGTTTSGAGGSILLYWASGRSATAPAATETINFVEYNGFSDTYLSRDPITRSWNWASFSSSSTAYFCFGTTTVGTGPNLSPTNPVLQQLDTVGLTVSASTFQIANFENGAQELLQNPASFDTSGNSIFGNFSVTRTAFNNNIGYIARNSAVGQFFRIQSFYRTVGSLGNPVQSIQKLVDIQGPALVEAELGNLSNGIYVFNNSGSIAAYSYASSSWSTGGPGINSVAYLSLQDTTKLNYADPANTLLVATDGDNRAFITFDYSSNVFLLFSGIDLSFTTLGARPAGDQWMLAIY